MIKSTLAILQARMSSNRLPGKVMSDINGYPMIYWQIRRILRAKTVSELVVVTSLDQSDDVLVNFLLENSYKVYRGSLNDVLSRFVEVSESYAHDAFIRITGDCPLIMPELIDQMVTRFYELNVDYLSNTLRPTFPDGLDIEIVKYGVLSQLSSLNLSTKEKEHVTYGIYNRPEQFSISNFSNVRDCSAQRWTVDYQQDLDFVRRVFLEFQARETEFSYEEINELLRQNPNFELANSFFERNEKLQNEVNDG